jgi:hypothetical protein
LDASEALRVAQSVMGADNPWGQKENLFALSNASLLLGLDAISDPQTLPLELDSGGQTNRIELKAIRTDDGSFDGRFRGEMFPPFRRGEIDWVTALGLRAPLDYRKMDKTLPLHLRYRFYFYMETLPTQDALYAHINFMQEDDEHRFGDFSRAFFEALDRQPVSRTVLDLRYNSGGNGALVTGFVHEFLRRSSRRPWGQLCLLTGRKTFSAALLLAGGLLEAIPDTVILGEPSGAGLNHFGDPMSFPIKGTGLRLSTSTVWHQGTSSREQRPFMAVNVPVEMDAKDYFAGRDPVLEAALDPRFGRSIETIAQREGGEAALAVLKERTSKFQNFEDWLPCSELRINELGYELIGRKAFEQAVQVLALNIHAFPGSWNAWDSYGEALAGAGHPEGARRAYRHALELNPGDSGARDYLNKFNSK